MRPVLFVQRYHVFVMGSSKDELDELGKVDRASHRNAPFAIECNLLKRHRLAASLLRHYKINQNR